MNFWRQLDILNPDMIVYPITLIGLGGIGSPAAFILAKMGCGELVLFDSDSVEEHNLPTTFYRPDDLGKKKAKALKENVAQFAETKIIAVPEAFCGQQELSGIVVSGVDSMESRRKIWKSVKYNFQVPLYIDGRTGGEVIQVFAVRPSNPEDIEAYEESLFSDKEAAKLACTAQGIIYTVVVLGGLIASIIKKWLCREEYNFQTTFDFKTMTLTFGDSVKERR